MRQRAGLESLQPSPLELRLLVRRPQQLTAQSLHLEIGARVRQTKTSVLVTDGDAAVTLLVVVQSDKPVEPATLCCPPTVPAAAELSPAPDPPAEGETSVTW